MNPTVKKIIHSATDSASMAISLAGASAGVMLTAYAVPDHWPATARLVLIAAAALLGAVSLDAAGELVLRPIRLRVSPYPTVMPAAQKTGGTGVTPTLETALEEITTATADDAAQQAAIAAWKLDKSDYLREAADWTGYPDGTATRELAPGIVLRCTPAAALQDGETPYPSHTFTLLMAGEEARPVSSIGQIRDALLAADTATDTDADATV